MIVERTGLDGEVDAQCLSHEIEQQTGGETDHSGEAESRCYVAPESRLGGGQSRSTWTDPPNATVDRVPALPTREALRRPAIGVPGRSSRWRPATVECNRLIRERNRRRQGFGEREDPGQSAESERDQQNDRDLDPDSASAAGSRAGPAGTGVGGRNQVRTVSRAFTRATLAV